MWYIIQNKRTDIRYDRPDLFNELWDADILYDLTPLQRYIAYLYYTEGLMDPEISYRVGIDRARVTEHRYVVIGKDSSL